MGVPCHNTYSAVHYFFTTLCISNISKSAMTNKYRNQKKKKKKFVKKFNYCIVDKSMVII